jgi:hypothetical protein
MKSLKKDGRGREEAGCDVIGYISNVVKLKYLLEMVTVNYFLI